MLSTSEKDSNKNPAQFLAGGGEMGELTRSLNWQQTSLGPMENWPQSLRTTLSIILNSKFPMFLFWGEELLCFYNDAYRPSLGNEGKHPAALGKPAGEVWVEIWPDIKPLIDRVLAGGEATWSENQLLPIFRNGKLEDVYWTFSYSPVNDETGIPAGVFVTCTETTKEVQNLQKRQLSDQRFQNLVRDASIGIVVLIGKEMRVELVNDMYGSLINSTPDELLNKNLFDVIPDAEAFFRPLLEEVLETGEPIYLYDTKYSVFVKGKQIDGYVNVTYQPYREENGQITGVMALCYDVTQIVNDRKFKAEIELRFRSLIEQSPVATCLFAGRDLVIKIANPSMISIWGKGQSVIGKTLREALPELEGQPFFELIDNLFVTGSAYTAKSGVAKLRIDGVLKTFYFDYTFTPLFDSNHNVYGIMETATDVTEKVLAQQKIEESEQNLRNIFRQAPVAMTLFKGPDFVVEIINGKALEQWGRTFDEVIGKPVFDVLTEAKGIGFEEILTTVYTTGKTYSAYGTPVPILRKGMLETAYLSFTYEPYRDAKGDITGVMSVSSEVTQEVISRKKIEESEARFRGLIAAAPAAIALFVGRDLIIETPNQPFIEITGKGIGIIGKPLREVLPELVSENQPFLKILDDIFSTGEMFRAFGAEIKVIKNGILSANYYDVTFTPILNADGEVYAILDISVDVTDNVLAQQKIEASEKSLRNTIIQAPVAMCIFKGIDHIVEIANERMLKLWGKTALEMIGKPVFDGLPEARDQGFEVLLNHVFKSGETIKAYEVPLLLSRNDEPETVYVDFVYEAFKENGGTVSGVMAVATEVTEQVLARKRIEQAEESARLAIESGDLGVYEVNLETQESVTSERFNVIWGNNYPVPRNELKEFIHPDDRAIRLKAHEESLKTGSLQYEARVIWPDSTAHWVKVMGRVMYDENNKPITLLGVIQDITEQKEFAEQLTRLVNERTAELNRSNEDLLQFAHVASHDLKEPVRKTMVFTNMLEDQYGTLLPVAGRTYLKKIKNASERMFSMIEGVLSYSTLNSSELPIEEVDLNDIFVSIESDLEVLIQQKNGIIKKDRLPVIEGAAVLIHQLFYNLVNNALKFSKSDVNSLITIMYSKISTTDRDFAEIVVADNGIGIDQEYAWRIFDAFSRLNAKDKYEGTGLGLALCKKIVERHEGTISATGIKDEGAVFTIMLPMKQEKRNI